MPNLFPCLRMPCFRCRRAWMGGDACALMCAYGTAHHALKQRAELRAGETVCILGAAGSTGFAAIQIAQGDGRQGDCRRFERRKNRPLHERPVRTTSSATTISRTELKSLTRPQRRRRAVSTRLAAMRSTRPAGPWRAAADCWSSDLLRADIPELPVNLTLVKDVLGRRGFLGLVHPAMNRRFMDRTWKS